MSDSANPETADRPLQQINRTDELVERVFRECNLVGNLTQAKLALGNAIDTAREDGYREGFVAGKTPDQPNTTERCDAIASYGA